MKIKLGEDIIEPLEEHSEPLPRLWKDPDTGQSMIEFHVLDGLSGYCLEKCVIVGCFEADVADDKKAIIKSRGVLRVSNGTIITAHPYESLRNLLWPKPVTDHYNY